MFNIGPAEMMVVLVIALLVLGPNKLPDAARQVGRALGELRRMSSGFQAEMRDALREPVEGTPSTAGTVKPNAPASAKGALSSPRPPAGEVAATDGSTIEPATSANGTAAPGDGATVEVDVPAVRSEADRGAAEPGANGTSPG